MKVAKGFTLIELVIVMGLIAILSAIAIPVFLRYRMRSKFAEMPVNIQALFKAEESMRQSERLIPSSLSGGPSRTGEYFGTGELPRACGGRPGAARQEWMPSDRAMAGAVDWTVEGSTYGCYNSAVNQGSGSPFGTQVTIWALSDLDGDGELACVALYKPMAGLDGSIAVAPPSPPQPCGAGDTIGPFAQLRRFPGEETY